MTGRRSLRQRELRSIVMVVTDILFHQPLQMTLIEDDDMIERIPAAVANPTLRDIILPWASEIGSLGLNAEALYGVEHFFIEIRSSVENPILRRGIIRERFPVFGALRNQRKTVRSEISKPKNWMPGRTEVSA
jgi:hypothetical protein